MEIASSLYADISKAIGDFERGKPEEISIKEGIFYTPAALAAKMARDTLSPSLAVLGFNDLLKIKILDPSCGSGIFLIACFQVLIEKLRELDKDTDYNREKVLQYCIFGIDKDEEALRLARRLLIQICYGKAAPKDALIPNLYTANALFDEKDFISKDENDSELLQEIKLVRDKSFPKRFSLVIGNPPYGLSRDEKLSFFENKKLLKTYSEYKIGKVNKYLAFMARGLELLDDGGCLSYVVPNAWLGIKAGQEIRKRLLSSGTIESIESFNRPIFPALDVEAIVFRFRKAGTSTSIKLIHYTDAVNFNVERAEKIQKTFCNDENEFRIPLTWSTELGEIRKHLQETCLPLSNFFEPLIALQAYSVGKGIPPQSRETVKSHAFHSKDKLSSDYYPYLDGKDIGRFKIRWNKQFLKYGPHLAEPQKIERFKTRRVILREILNPYPYLLSAAYTSEAYLYNKSVLHILDNGERSEEDFFTLLGILNSSLAGFIIQHFGRKSQRKLFPKIVNADLKTFPIPKGLFGTINNIAKTAKEISQAYELNEKDRGDYIKDLQEQLDKNVIIAYGLEKLP